MSAHGHSSARLRACTPRNAPRLRGDLLSARRSRPAARSEGTAVRLSLGGPVLRGPGAVPGRRRLREGGLIRPDGLVSYFLVRPLSDLFLWLWRLERRLEFLYRPMFDRWLRPPLFEFAQALQNRKRPDEHLGIAEERR